MNSALFLKSQVLLICYFSPDDHLKLSPYLSYISGALAGCAATIGSYPFDLVRTILASQGEPKVCFNFLQSVYLDAKIVAVKRFHSSHVSSSDLVLKVV